MKAAYILLALRGKMRHQTQGQINLNLQRVALVSLTLLFLLVSLESFSASTKFGQACKFSLMKPQKTSDEFSFDSNRRRERKRPKTEIDQREKRVFRHRENDES